MRLEPILSASYKLSAADWITDPNHHPTCCSLHMIQSFVTPVCAATKPDQHRYVGPRSTIVAALAALLCATAPPSTARAASLQLSQATASSSISELYLARRQSRNPVNVDTTTLVIRQPFVSEREEPVRSPALLDVLARPKIDAAAEMEMLTRMCFAVTCGAIIGVERRAASATAGVRTNALVSLGSSIFVLTALYGLQGPSIDSGVAKMCAAVISGCGFLGAGAINRSGKGNRNLTTSASIWIAATLGVASALGLYRLALKGALFTVFILRLSTLSRYTRLVLRRRWRMTVAFVRRRLGWRSFGRRRQQCLRQRQQDEQPLVTDTLQ
jgi:uncharacterized membrane protein YhiD involved in acid resistance